MMPRDDGLRCARGLVHGLLLGLLAWAATVTLILAGLRGVAL